MAKEKRTIEEVDQYIPELPKEIQAITTALRKIILKSSPVLMEEFKWSMPIIHLMVSFVICKHPKNMLILVFTKEMNS